MAVSMVRCSPVSGPITTDKVHRKYLATLPNAAAIYPFPVYEMKTTFSKMKTTGNTGRNI